MAKFPFLLAIAFAWTIAGCAREDACDELMKKTQQQSFIPQLEKWVDEKTQKNALVDKNVKGKFFIPGEYAISMDDALKASLGPDFAARAVLDSHAKVESIFFGRGNFDGFLVTLAGEENTIVPHGALRPISQRSYLICGARD